jgi:hypothetical protein
MPTFCCEHGEREADGFCRDCGSAVCSQCAPAEADGRVCTACAREQRQAHEASVPAVAASASVGAAVAAVPRRGFRELSVLAKFLAIYVLVVSAITGFPWGMDSFGGFTQTALGWMGLAAAVLMIMARPLGWWLGLAWSLAQVVPVIVERQCLNRQFLAVSWTQTVNGDGFGINAVGIILAVLFLLVRRQFLEGYAREV